MVDKVWRCHVLVVESQLISFAPALKNMEMFWQPPLISVLLQDRGGPFMDSFGNMNGFSPSLLLYHRHSLGLSKNRLTPL